MKAVLKFLLNTGAGKLIVQALVGWVIAIIKKRLGKLEEYKRSNLETFLDVIHQELHADIHAGKIKPTDML